MWIGIGIAWACVIIGFGGMIIGEHLPIWREKKNEQITRPQIHYNCESERKGLDESNDKRDISIPQYQTTYNFELERVKCENCGKVGIAKNREMVFIKELIDNRFVLTHHFLCFDCYNEIMCNAINKIREKNNNAD